MTERERRKRKLNFTNENQKQIQSMTLKTIQSLRMAWQRGWREKKKNQMMSKSLNTLAIERCTCEACQTSERESSRGCCCSPYPSLCSGTLELRAQASENLNFKRKEKSVRRGKKTRDASSSLHFTLDELNRQPLHCKCV